MDATGTSFMGMSAWKPMSHSFTVRALNVNRYRPPGTSRISSTLTSGSDVTSRIRVASGLIEPFGRLRRRRNKNRAGEVTTCSSWDRLMPLSIGNDGRNRPCSEHIRRSAAIQTIGRPLAANKVLQVYILYSGNTMSMSQDRLHFELHLSNGNDVCR